MELQIISYGSIFSIVTATTRQNPTIEPTIEKLNEHANRIAATTCAQLQRLSSTLSGRGRDIRKATNAAR